MSGGLRLLDVVTLGGKGRRFKLAAGIIGVEHPIFEKSGRAVVVFDIFATIWNVDGNWNGFSSEELWGRIGV